MVNPRVTNFLFLPQAEAINIGADFVAQVSAIAIGMLIIEFCDYLAKKNQQKRVDEIEVHIKGKF